MKRLIVSLVILLLGGYLAYASTISLLKDAVEKDPDNVRLRRDLADEYLREKYFSDAVREYKIIIEKGNADSDTVFYLAIALFYMQDYPNALFYADTAASMPQAQDISPLYYNIAVKTYTSGDYDTALSSALKAYKLNTKDPSIVILLGSLYFNHKQEYDTALEYFKKADAMQLTPEQRDQNKSNIMRALFNISVKQFNAFVADQKSVKKDEILKNLSLVQDARKNISATYIAKNPSLIDIWLNSVYMKSQVYKQTDDFIRAKKEMFLIFDEKKDFVGLSDMLMNLGVTFYEKKDYFSSIECYARVMTLTDSDSDTLLNIGLYYISQGEWETALWYLERGIELDPTNTSALRTMTFALDNIVTLSLQKGMQDYKAKRFDDAFVNFSKAKTYRPNNDTALQYLAKIDVTQLNGKHFFIRQAKGNEKESFSDAKLAFKLSKEYFNKGEYIKSFEQILKAIESNYTEKEYRLMFLKLYPIVTARREEGIVQLNELLNTKKVYDAEKLLTELQPALDASLYDTYRERIDAIGKQRKYGSVESDLKTAERYFKQGNYIQAKVYFRRVQKSDPANQDARRYLAQIAASEQKLKVDLRTAYANAEARQDTEAMRSAVNQTLSMDGNDAWALQKRAQLDKLTQASDDENRKNAHKLYLEGINKYTLGDYSGAIQLWKEVIKLAGNYKNVRDYIQRAEAKLKG